MRTKNKIKNYLKLGVFLFGVIFFINSCNQEDIPKETENQFFRSVSNISFSNLKNKKNIYKKIKKILTKNKSNNLNFTIDTTAVQVLTSQYYTNYTFKAIMNNNDTENLNNYVLTIFNNNKFYQMLIQYPIISYLNGIENYDLNNINAEPIFGNIIIPKSFGDCVGGVSWEWIDTTVTYNCTEGANCTGLYCTGQWVEPYNVTIGAWISVCNPYYIVADDPYNGGGGGANTNNSSNNNNNENNNLIIGTTPFKGDIITIQEPCDKLKELEEDTYIKQQLNDLKTVIADNDNINYEVAIIFTKLNTTEWGLDVVTGTPTEPNYSFNIGPDLQVDLLVHTHYKGILSIFSPYDLKTYYDLLNANVATTNLVSILITNSGTKYAFKVTDLNKFNTITEEHFTTIEKLNDFAKKEFRKIKKRNSNNKNEKEFLKIMNKLDLGISLFKANDDFSQWQELELIDDVVTPKDCD